MSVNKQQRELQRLRKSVFPFWWKMWELFMFSLSDANSCYPGQHFRCYLRCHLRCYPTQMLSDAISDAIYDEIQDVIRCYPRCNQMVFQMICKIPSQMLSLANLGVSRCYFRCFRYYLIWRRINLEKVPPQALFHRLGT